MKANNKTDGVIIITAKNSLDDKVNGRNLGADDCLAKPFFMPELIARVSAIIRRKRFGDTKISFGNVVIDVLGKNVFVRNREIDLTRKEYDLLLFLMSNKNRVVSKNAIAAHLRRQRGVA